MSKTVIQEGDEGVRLIIRDRKPNSPKKIKAVMSQRLPVHVVYGGADRFAAGTAGKLGDIALRSLESYVPDAAGFAAAFGLPRVEEANRSDNTKASTKIRAIAADKRRKPAGSQASLSAAVRERTLRKLRSEPVEDFRIDFEDGYGFRSDPEEDADAERCAAELAKTFREGSITAFSGIRIKPYASETRERARRTLNIFLDDLLEATNGKLPDNFVVTLPKVTDRKEVGTLCRDLKKIEKMNRLKEGTVKIELMIEHPLAIIDRKGNFALRGLVDSAGGRCVAAHFGAFDLTAALGIAASYQDIAHPACDIARQLMLLSLKPLGIRLSDSVTTEMPVPIHKGEKLSDRQKAENQSAVVMGWQKHFQNIRRSMANGFYQSWDLHPNQLLARYAAVYSFFLENLEPQAKRLRAFFNKATQATLTGQAFDDAATAMGIINFFRQGLDCGALTEAEITNAAGITAAQLRSSSFKNIADTYRP